MKRSNGLVCDFVQRHNIGIVLVVKVFVKAILIRPHYYYFHYYYYYYYYYHHHHHHYYFSSMFLLLSTKIIQIGITTFFLHFKFLSF